MTFKPARRNPPFVQAVPTFLIDTQQVEDAWQAYNALQLAAREKPALVENEYFKALQDTAYARFLMAFEAL